jgi:hypothetical protein
MIVCQSDYDKEDQFSTRQADECLENWWEPEVEKAELSPKKDVGVSISHPIVDREARRRGLLRGEE